jgi:hypothetical protein
MVSLFDGPQNTGHVTHRWQRRASVWRLVKGSGTFCRNGPSGASHKRCRGRGVCSCYLSEKSARWLPVSRECWILHLVVAYCLALVNFMLTTPPSCPQEPSPCVALDYS